MAEVDRERRGVGSEVRLVVSCIDFAGRGKFVELFFRNVGHPFLYRPVAGSLALIKAKMKHQELQLPAR